MVTEQEAQYWADELDCEARNIEQIELTRSIGEDFSENCLRLAEEASTRCSLIEQGKRPMPFGAYDRDEIERILATDLNLIYEGYILDYEADLKKCTDLNEVICKTTNADAARESLDRYHFLEEFRKYLKTAASFAKSIGAFPAMRLYLRAYLLVEKLVETDALPPENAKRFSVFERMATELLTVDYLAAQLPPFKRPKKKVAKTTKKASTKKKGGGK